MKGSMFTSEFIERELRRRRNWKHKFGVLGLLRHVVRVLRPDVTLLNRLAQGQKTRMADWSLLAVAEQLDERRDMFVVSNDTTIAADITRSAVGCRFLDDESFLRLLISLATFYPGARAGHLVTIYSRVRDSIVNRASRDQEWYRQLSALSAESEILIGGILESHRGRVAEEMSAETGLYTDEIPASPESLSKDLLIPKKREAHRYNVTYSGNSGRGTDRGIVMLGSPGTGRRDNLPKDWVRLMANDISYWGKFVKIALNVVKESPTESRLEPNLLDGILRTWFGRDGILPGAPVCHVGFRKTKSEAGTQLWEMFPFQLDSD